MSPKAKNAPCVLNGIANPLTEIKKSQSPQTQVFRRAPAAAFNNLDFSALTMNPIEEEKRKVKTERKVGQAQEDVKHDAASCTSKEKSSTGKSTIFGKKRDCSAPIARD